MGRDGRYGLVQQQQQPASYGRLGDCVTDPAECPGPTVNTVPPPFRCPHERLDFPSLGSSCSENVSPCLGLVPDEPLTSGQGN